MKMLKASLFLFAVLVASVAAISSSNASNSTASAAVEQGEIWVKYNCTLGTESQPVLQQQDLDQAQVVIADGQESNFCEDLNGVICAAKYSFDTNTASTSAQLIKDPVTGQYRFNPNYVGGEEAAVEDRLADIKCPTIVP